MVAPIFMAVQSEAILLALPKDMHLIVGLETQTVFPFDQEIHLDVKYSMLREDHWDEAERIVGAWLEKMNETMKFNVET